MARVQAFIAAVVIASMLSPAGGEAAASTECDAHFHATLIAHMCPPTATVSPGSDCCHVVLLGAEHGGLACLCKVAATPRLLVSGIRAQDVIDWHRSCLGERIAAPGPEEGPACSATSPPPPVARALPAEKHTLIG